MQAMKILTSVEYFDLVYGKVITRAATSRHYGDYSRAQDVYSLAAWWLVGVSEKNE